MPRKSLNKSVKIEKLELPIAPAEPDEPMEQSEEIFEVEAILDKRFINGKVNYLVFFVSYVTSRLLLVAFSATGFSKIHLIAVVNILTLNNVIGFDTVTVTLQITDKITFRI